jgi:PKD domain
MRAVRVVALGVGALFVALVPVSAAGTDFNGDAVDDTVTVTAREAAAAERAWQASTTDPAARLTEYQRADLCGVASADLSTAANGDCATNAGAIQLPTCEGQAPVPPLWRRDRVAAPATWGAWRFVTGWSCPQDALPAFTVEDFRRLPLAPPALRIQPDTAQVLVNLATITMTDPTPQLLVTALLGYPLEVQATPTVYSWDYGDGTAPLVTTSPGHPWPDQDVTHTYRAPGTYQITLTATWVGQYRLAGTTTWTPITGTAATQATHAPITAIEVRAHLVAGDCTAAPRPNGC